MILVAPTAIGDTWSLMEPQVDSAQSGARAGAGGADVAGGPVKRLLLTGMSDGGTFTLLSGLDEDRRSPTSRRSRQAFHPLLLTMAEPRR